MAGASRHHFETQLGALVDRMLDLHKQRQAAPPRNSKDPKGRLRENPSGLLFQSKLASYGVGIFAPSWASRPGTPPPSTCAASSRVTLPFLMVAVRVSYGS